MTEQETIIKAFTEMAPDYEVQVDRELKTFWGWGYESLLSRMLAVASVSDHDFVLDVATGTAAIPLRLSQDNQNLHKVVGLDITYAMLAQANQKLVKNSRVVLTCATATSMPFRSESFDMITCGLATHHIEISPFLQEVRRVLKSDGKLIIADVCVPALFRKLPIRWFLKLATFLYFLWTSDYQRAQAEVGAIENVRTRQEWQATLKQMGFDDILLERLPSKYSWIPAPIVIRAPKCN